MQGLVVKALSCLGHRPHMREFQASHQRFCSGGGSGEGGAEEVGFEPTDPCRSHDFQSCRFGRSRTPPTSLSPLSLHLLALSRAVAGFCATGDRESSQGRKAAALSGFVCVPQGTWLLRTTAREPESAPLGMRRVSLSTSQALIIGCSAPGRRPMCTVVRPRSVRFDKS